jgi:ABC-type glycerol-3-phosphate transport system substrate-binding protein
MLKLARLVVLTFAVIALASACGGEGHEAGEGLTPSPSAPATGKIAFTSWRDGNNQIYVMNPGGSSQTRLTDNPAWDGTPAWSP